MILGDILDNYAKFKMDLSTILIRLDKNKFFPQTLSGWFSKVSPKIFSSLPIALFWLGHFVLLSYHLYV